MDYLIIIGIVLLVLVAVVAYYLGRKIGGYQRDRYWEAEIPSHRQDAIVKSRAVLGGQFSEQLAPFLPGFSHSPTECRFIGKPVDFLVFKGMDEKNISEIVFLEVKSGNSKLSPQEKNLKNAVENKRVRWEEYRVPDELTKKREFEE